MVCLGNEHLFDDGTRQFLKRIVDIINEDEVGISVADPDKVNAYTRCYLILKALFKGTNAIVKCSQSVPFNSAATISILTPRMEIMDTEAFVYATRLASNYEIYPRTDGRIMMELIFYDMTNKG